MIDEIGEASARRRTFAIIGHPGAGRTTLTEKILISCSATEEASAVRARRDRLVAMADGIDMEQGQGRSITSPALRFHHRSVVMNLLDTQGDQGFSEDSYRILAAADCMLMVIDAAKGVESEALKLYEVSRSRGTPLLMFVNKMDRPSLEPLALLDNIRSHIRVEPTPGTWPVSDQGDFQGVFDQRDGTFHHFGRTQPGATGAVNEKRILADEVDRDEPTIQRALDEVALLSESGLDVDETSFLAGESTPVFFGSALYNFGIGLLLDALVELAPPPASRQGMDGHEREITDDFSGFVFKVQATMNPKHQDRIAFVRVCSGRLVPGANATHARTGRPFTLNITHRFFGHEGETKDVAYPGDIVGLANAVHLRIGDTLHAGRPVEFPAIPRFAPEHFMIVRNRDASRYKQFRRSLVQLEEEGVVQVLRHPDRGDREPVLAAVGPVQFEVARYRLEESGVPVALVPTNYEVARLTDENGEAFLEGSWRATDVLRRSDGARVALFTSAFQLELLEQDHPELVLRQIIAT